MTAERQVKLIGTCVICGAKKKFSASKDQTLEMIQDELATRKAFGCVEGPMEHTFLPDWSLKDAYNFRQGPPRTRVPFREFINSLIK